MNSSTNNNPILSPYLLSRFHQHLNHLNDMAFAHTKILQEIIEKRSIESMTSSSSPHGSISSSPSSSSSTIDSTQQQQRKRSYPCNDDNHEIKNENKRPRKQSKPQQLLKPEQNQNKQPSSLSEEDEEQEMGEINESIDKQTPLPIPSSTMLPFIPHNLPFLNYIQDLARANNITSPVSMGRFVENLQKELFTAAMESKRLPPPPTLPSFLPPTVHHHHHHPYFSQILFNNSYVNHFPPSTRFGHPPSDDHPFHFSTPKKRRTKVTDTRLSPRITSKIVPQSNFDDLTDDENTSSHHSSDGNPTKSDQQSIEYNGFQISDLLLFFFHLRERANKLTYDYLN